MNPPVCLYPDTDALTIACELCGHEDAPERPVLWDSAEVGFYCVNSAECVRRQNERKKAVRA